MLDNTDRALAEVIDKLNSLASPETLEVMVRVTWLNSIGNIVTALAGLGLTYALARMTNVAGRFTKQKLDSFAAADDLLGVAGVFGTIALGLATAAIASICVLELLNQWNWIGMFDPQTALAHELMVKTGGRP